MRLPFESSFVLCVPYRYTLKRRGKENIGKQKEVCKSMMYLIHLKQLSYPYSEVIFSDINIWNGGDSCHI